MKQADTHIERPVAPNGPLRRDAVANRERIVAAGRAVFKEQGPDAPIIHVARRAGVSTATLYRRFPTRAALADEIFAAELESCAAMVSRAAAAPDPWHGFSSVIAMMCVWPKSELTFGQSLLARFPDSPLFTNARNHIEDQMSRLIERAQAAGDLRPDFRWSDVLIFMAASHGVASMFSDDPATAGRRLTAYALQAFRAETTARPLPPPPAAAFPVQR